MAFDATNLLNLATAYDMLNSEIDPGTNTEQLVYWSTQHVIEDISNALAADLSALYDALTQ